MVEELLPKLYRIEVPLPRSPLKALNSYVVRGEGRSLIIDTGMNREECLRPLLDSLKELNVDLNKTDLFITHLHADHLGLVSNLATDTSIIYFNQADAAYMNSVDSQREKAPNFARINGFPEEELQRAIKNHPGRKYSSRVRLDFYILKEGDSFGEYSLIEKRPASASVVGVQPGDVLRLDRDSFEEVMLNDRIGKTVYKNLLRILIRRLRQKEAELDLVLVAG